MRDENHPATRPLPATPSEPDGAKAAPLERARRHLHDLGKIAVADAILNKPSPLTEDEAAEMRRHPEHGARILGTIQAARIKAVLPGVRSHHERWDGSGYPDGLEGEAIPLLGRLIGVADFFDAMTSTRAYRPALRPADAVQRIREAAGTHFDPTVAAAVVRLFERGALGTTEDAGEAAPGARG